MIKLMYYGKIRRNIMAKYKFALVINGKGGVGKDTLCEAAAKRFKVRNVSSITPIKEIAALCGWDGAKDDRSRKFLADMKKLCVDYNNYPTAWLRVQYEEFLASDDQIMFVHIREPEEIEKFVKATGGKAMTMLISGGSRLEKSVYGNAADDNVENYEYDFIFENVGEIEEMREAFCCYLDHIIRSKIEDEERAKERAYDVMTHSDVEAMRREEILLAEERKRREAEIRKRALVDYAPGMHPAQIRAREAMERERAKAYAEAKKRRESEDVIIDRKPSDAIKRRELAEKRALEEQKKKKK